MDCHSSKFIRRKIMDFREEDRRLEGTNSTEHGHIFDTVNALLVETRVPHNLSSCQTAPFPFTP